jgi:hypothetical protein
MSPRQHVRRHLAWGWGLVLVYVALGLTLEVLHALKLGAYLDPEHATRRLMLTLGHAHGTLLGLVHVAYAATVRALPDDATAGLALASRCLVGAGVLVPLGFLLGGLFAEGGDPGLGILAVPAGAALLLLAVLLTWRAVRR